MFENPVNWKKWGLAAIGIIIVVAVLLGPGHLKYRQLKENQALKIAQEAFARNDYRNAALSVQQVLQLNPTNIAACQLMAELADLANSPTTLDWRKRAAETAPTIENKLLLAEAALRFQSPPYPLTAQILEELRPAATNVARFHVVSAERALAMRQLGEAEVQFSAAARLAPANRLYQLNQAMVVLSSTNAAKLAAARASLKSFLADTNFAANALRGLITDSLAHNDLAAARNFSEQLLRNSQAALADQLQHLTILKNLPAADFSSQLAAIKKNVATNSLGTVQTALWMQANQLAPEAAVWLAGLPAGLRNQPTVEMARACALEAAGDWPSLRDFCGRSDWDEINFLRLAFLSHAWAHLGEPPVASGNWHAAVDTADNRYGALIGLLELTGRWKLASERQDLFWLMLQKFPRERWISLALEQHCLAAGDTTGLMRVYQQLSATFPDNAGFQNNFAYTSLLLKKNPTEAASLAAKLHKQFPADASIASTHAFALHLRGHNAEALAVMQQLTAELEQPAIALHYGILLASVGKTLEAQPYLAIARKNASLLPEEKALLETVPTGH